MVYTSVLLSLRKRYRLLVRPGAWDEGSLSTEEFYKTLSA